MNKKKQFLLNQTVNETFSTFEPLLKAEEKAPFWDLVEKAEKSDKLQDRKQLYQTIYQLLSQYNFSQYKEQEEHLEYLSRDFDRSAARYTKDINNWMGYYADGKTDITGDDQKMAEFLAKKFDFYIELLKDSKQEFEKAYANFKSSINGKTGLLTNEDWRGKYFHWIRKNFREIVDIEEDFDKRRKFSTVDADLAPESFFEACVTAPLFIPAVAAYGLLQLITKAIEAPRVIKANLSKEKEEIPAVNKLFDEIKQSVLIEGKDLRFDSHSKIDVFQPDHFIEQFDQVLQQMDERIKYFEQARPEVLAKYTTKSANQINDTTKNADKKSKFIMPIHASHLIEQREIDICNAFGDDINERYFAR